MSGTMVIPRDAARAGSMSDAESVTTATRTMAGPPSSGRDPSRRRKPGGGNPAGAADRLGAMDRSLKAVLIGTFTLRFSTGLTGAMLQLYLSHFTDFHPDAVAVSALTVGVFAATFY